MTANNTLREFDVDYEQGVSRSLAARDVMMVLGLHSLDHLSEIAVSATSVNLGRVLNLASFVGVDEEIIDKIHDDSPGLILPNAEIPLEDRMCITSNYGSRKTTVIKPSMLFLKQAFLSVQFNYADVVGFGVPQVDYDNIKREALAYTYRYGLGSIIMRELKSKMEKDMRVFPNRDRQFGESSFAAFFATYIPDPSPKEIIFGDSWHAEYVAKFSGWIPESKEVLSSGNPKRTKELNDAHTKGMTRPMTLEEVEATVKAAKQKRRPLLRSVKL